MGAISMMRLIDTRDVLLRYIFEEIFIADGTGELICSLPCRYIISLLIIARLDGALRRRLGQSRVIAAPRATRA